MSESKTYCPIHYAFYVVVDGCKECEAARKESLQKQQEIFFEDCIPEAYKPDYAQVDEMLLEYLLLDDPFEDIG